VKFAREKPLPSFNEANLEHAYDFVRRTRPVIEPVMKDIPEGTEVEETEIVE
jgi:hypothetical protein